MLYADLSSADVGWGKESLDEAMQRWATNGRTVHFTNISRNDTYKDCQMRFFWDYVHGGTGVVREDAVPFHAFALGTAMHDGVESLLQTFELHGEAAWDIAADVARASAEVEWGDHATAFTPKNHDHNLNFLGYVDDVLIACGRKIEQTVEEVLATEQLVWACVPMRNIQSEDIVEWICVMGRADAFIVKGGEVWHLQHKTTSKTGDYEAYMAKLAFGGHETGYGWIASQLIKEGKMPGVRVSTPYGGSIVNMIQKRAKPESQPKAPAKKTLEAIEKNHVIMELGGEGLNVRTTMERGECTDKQWEGHKKTWDTWVDAERKRLAVLADYDETVVQFLDVDLDAEKIEVGMYHIVWGAFGQRTVEVLTLDLVQKHPGLVQRNTNACERFGSDCPRIESVTCGGWEAYEVLDPDSGWAPRPDDYINEVRNHYADLESRV